ncbi:MFS transporter [Motilibacter deserti]|uniref:MFS transporter n=1 Tax=Motilibacter deserti TaxID=2714956 RepID=A0ABX0GYI5_9ACTN|nr:MFS transporter [Motilibacter deserti]NHC16062.1 MFS transporter [Motilibacter deserti]
MRDVLEPQAAATALRRLLWGRAVSAVGDGLWFTVWALYFTGVLGMSGTAVGAGMGVAAAAGLVAAVPLGALGDRYDPARVLLALTVARAAAMAAYLVVDGVVAFVAVTVAFVGLANGSSALRTALVAALVEDNAARVRALSAQRVAQHAGIAVGAGLGALVLAVDEPGAYRLAVAANVASYLVLAALTATLPAVPVPAPAAGGPARAAGMQAVLRDRAYLLVVGVTAVLSLCWAMLSTGLPLWVAGSTQLPLALSGAVVVLSSVGIAVLQIPAARVVRTPAQSARTALASGMALAVSCLLLASTASRGGPGAGAVVVLAALLHIAGEVGYVAAAWSLSVSLMREDARGAYQGAAESATAAVQVFGPGFFTLALGSLGAGGWVLGAAVFALAGLGVRPATRRAERTRAAVFAATPQLRRGLSAAGEPNLEA